MFVFQKCCTVDPPQIHIFIDQGPEEMFGAIDR